ncbi:MAG TPA: histidinol-phosphate transaminase [Clostridiales bacterium]|nr:histidinol-phosphate transaminase [Clostridiales bacterium]
MRMEYLREDLRSLKAYQVVQETCTLKLDANESPFPVPLEIRAQLATELLNGSNFQLYPDTNADPLRDALAKQLELERENILIGNGSDELLHIVTTAFAGPGDRVLCPSPGFGMVSYYARLTGAVPVDYSLNERFQYSLPQIEKSIIEHQPKILHICTPNNPTGGTMAVSDIASLARWYDGVVVVDEAYYEFHGETTVSMINRLPNVVVLRTFSKAMGLAGLRVGYLICNKYLAREIYKVKPPYNVNGFSQRAAELMLEHRDIQMERVREIVEAREWLYQALEGLRGIDPYPSRANFILIKVKDAAAFYKGLLEKGILVKHFADNPVLKNHLRITIGRKDDNKYILHSLAEILTNMEDW